MPAVRKFDAFISKPSMCMRKENEKRSSSHTWLAGDASGLHCGGMKFDEYCPLEVRDSDNLGNEEKATYDAGHKADDRVAMHQRECTDHRCGYVRSSHCR